MARDFLQGHWPECAVCKKPVEHIDQWQDLYADQTVIRIACHGQIQRINITGQLIAANRGEFKIDKNWKAFDEREPKQLP